MIKVDLPHEPLLIEFIHLSEPEELLRKHGYVKGSDPFFDPVYFEDPEGSRTISRFTRCVIGPASCKTELKELLTAWAPTDDDGHQIALVGWGVSVCHPFDEWDRGKARRYSLAAALRNVRPSFSKAERRDIWDAYFTSTTDYKLRQ
jgi:hypothetical protein